MTLPPADARPGAPDDGRSGAPAPTATADGTTGASVAAGGVWNTASLVLPQAYTLVVSVVAARSLGPDDMGRQSFISFVQISLLVLLSSGMQHVLTRFVGHAVGQGRPDDVRLLVRWSWRVQVLAALVGGSAMVAIAVNRPDLRTSWLFAAFACTAAVLHAVPSSLLRGLQEWRAASAIALVTGAVGMVVGVTVLLAGGGIVGIFVVEAVTGALSLTWAQVVARRALSRVPPIRFDGHRPDLRDEVARAAILSTIQGLLFLVVWRRSEFFFLERYSTVGEIAMYSVAFAASAALVQVPQGLATVLTPAIAQLSGAGETARIRSGLGRAMRLLILVSLPLAAGAAAVGPTVLEVVYGSEYRRAGTVLVILVMVIPVMPLYYLATSLLYAVNRVRAVLGASLVATVVNVSLDLVLVPASGAVGAAVANVGAQATAGVLMVVLASRAVSGLDWDAWRLVRAALAAAGAGFAALAGVRLLPGLPGAIVGGVAGALVFAVLGLGLRILSPADAAWLDAHGGHLGRGVVRRACRPFLSTP